MKITPHSSWRLRKQKLSEFNFNDSIREVPSMVLNGAEVMEGITLVKELPDSEGAIVKEYSSDYKSHIMAHINPKELEVIVLRKSTTDTGISYLVGVRINQRLGALHPGRIAHERNQAFFLLGMTNSCGFSASEGQRLVVNISNVKRILKNGRILYELDMDPVKVNPAGMGASLGEIDNLVSGFEEIESKFNIGDLVSKDDMIGELVNVYGHPELAEVIWENGVIERHDPAELDLAKETHDDKRLSQAQDSIIRERVLSDGPTTTATPGIDSVQGESVGGLFKTSINDGHRHTWSARNTFTSTDDGHNHRINIAEGIAEEADGHTHNLLKTKAMSELDDVFKRYHEFVNMSASELEKWSNNPCSQKASQDRSPIKRNLELLKTDKSDWTDKHITWANKTIAFISRMRNVEQGKPVGDCPSKRDISLKNWAWDPGK